MKKLNVHDFDKAVMPWIGKTGKLLFLFMTDKFKKYDKDLSVEQFIILKILHDQDGRPQNDMALVTDRHKASLTRILDNMERKHLVTRIADKEDKRVKRIYLTKHGKEYFQTTLPVIEEAMHEIQKGLSKKEIETLIDLLKKVQHNIAFNC